jgi:hypothetical protein
VETRFIISEEALNSDNNFLVRKLMSLVNASFYDISAIDKNGIPIHEFNQLIKITLPIARDQRGVANLKLYWLNETNWSWVLIPDAVFEKDKVTFYINHLTRFAIFADQSVGSANTKIESSISLPKEKKAEYENMVNQKEENKKENKKNSNDYLVIFALIILVIILVKIKRKFD